MFPFFAERLAESIPCGYHPGGPAASEPTVLAGLALAGSGRDEEARLAADWIANLQAANGSIGVTESQPSPCWPTSLAILLWHALDSLSDDARYTENTTRAVNWALADRGRPNKQQAHIGHNTMLVGWSWAPDTHSWLEPTAMFVLALKAVGQSQHVRTREAVRLLIDRLLPNGGANYGNTIVLGQPLLPHVQPTGLAMLALADEGYEDPRIERSLEYLERELPHTIAMASLCYGLLGLTAHGRRPTESDAWLERTYDRMGRSDSSSHKLALLALAFNNNSPNVFNQQEESLTRRR